MAIVWTLSTQEIIRDAVEILAVYGADETISPEDYSTSLRTFQNLLKELPLHGWSWPKITVAPTALTWSALTPNQVAMPVDYIGVPQIWYEANSVNVNLEVISKAEYVELLQPDYVELYPKKIYIAPNNVGFLWPVPSADPALQMTYQAIVLDAEQTVTPDVMQSVLGCLTIWLAYELLPKFDVPAAKAADITQRFIAKRGLMLSWAAETAPLSIQVAD